MVDKQETITWIQRELNGLTEYIKAVDRRCTECRIHCDRSRESCTLKGDYEKRLRILETVVTAMQASTWKGAILIGSCTIISVTITIIMNYFFKLR